MLRLPYHQSTTYILEWTDDISALLDLVGANQHNQRARSCPAFSTDCRKFRLERRNLIRTRKTDLRR